MNRRRPAFDPTRLDDLDDLLPVPEPSTPQVTAQPVAAPREAVPAPSAPAPGLAAPREAAPAPAAPAATAPPRQPRGQGGRPVTRRGPTRVREEMGETSRVPVAVRVPRLLYEDINNDLLAGPERPSYGQLVIWTCEDHPEDIATAVRAARAQPGGRRPRGRRLAADTVQVTLRLTPGERELIDGIVDELRGAQGSLVTRTEVAAAALRLALSHPPE